MGSSSLLFQGKLSEQVFQNFRGMNRRSDRLNTNYEFYFDLQNGYAKKDLKSGLGFVVQRDGATKLNAVALDTITFGSTKFVRTIFEARWYGGGADVIIRAGTAWGRFDGVDTFVGLDTGRGDGAIGQCAMFKNELIMVDGGVPRKATAGYSVSALSADSDMPQDSDAVWVHRDKVWLNSQANPMLAFFCTTNSANGDTSWSGTDDAGTLDLSTVLPEGDRIRGFRTYGGQDSGLIAIICDKYTVIYSAGADVSTFNFLQYFPTTCVSINACDYLGNDIVYPSRNCFTSLSHSYGTNDVATGTLSDLIEPYWRTLVSQCTDTTQIQGCFDKTLGLFYILFPIANNYQILVYSDDMKNFVGRYTYPFSVFSFRYRLNGSMLMGSDGYVYLMNNGNDDDGVATPWSFKMPGLYFGTPSRNKKPIEFEALLQCTASMTLFLDYYYGLNTLQSQILTVPIDLTATSNQWDTSLWDSSYWDQSGNTIFRTSDLLGRGRIVFLEMRHATRGAKVAFPWFLLRYMMEGIN